VSAAEAPLFFFFTLVTGHRRSLSLKLSDTRVYEPHIRARLGTTAHFCRVVILKLNPKSCTLKQVLEMCPQLKQEGSYSRRIDFLYHSTLGLRVIKEEASTLHLQAGVGDVSAAEVPLSSRQPPPDRPFPSQRGPTPIRGTARAEDAQGTPTQSSISPSILVHEEKHLTGFYPKAKARICP